MRILLFLLAVCCFSSVHADPFSSVVYGWGLMYFAMWGLNIPVVIAGLLVEIGFVKYFAKANWTVTILVTIAMNVVSSVSVIFLAFICMIIEEIFSDFVLLPKTELFKLLVPYAAVVLLNTVIKWPMVKSTFELPFSKIYRWLFVANAISVGICLVYSLIFFYK